MSAKTKYFIFIIVAFGLIGIWLPQVIYYAKDGSIKKEELPLCVTTYIISFLVVEFTAYGLKLFNNFEFYIKTSKLIIGEWLNLIIIFVASIILAVLSIIFHVSGSIDTAIILSLIGLILSYIFWWINNKDNQSFNANASLGGSIGEGNE